MVNTELIKAHQAFIFSLDDVIYPEKDYWLQVYYLFAQFIEYGEQTDAGPIVTFMTQIYQAEGREGIFEKTVQALGIPEKYKENFDLLQHNARLPLKLLLYANVLDFMKAVAEDNKPIALLVDGDPVIQLNKIRQIEWNGLERYLRVYFLAEMKNGYQEGIERIAQENQIDPEGILLIGNSQTGINLANFNTLKFVETSNLSLL